MHSFKSAFLGAIGLVVGCGSPPALNIGVSQTGKPVRVVSLDYCADQFVLRLADRGDIVALSPDAARDFSYLRHQAVGLKTVRPSAEDVLALKPDLIVRSYGGGPNATAFFERAGIKVHQIGWGDDFDAVRDNVGEAAASLGHPMRGAAVIREFDQRLAQIKPAQNISTLYVTAGGVTTGSGSMIDLMMRTAGLVNFQQGGGWNPLPLERLVCEQPQMVATAFFGSTGPIREYWSPSRHQIVQHMMQSTPVAAMDGATTACAGWFVMDGVEALAAKGAQVQP